MEIDLSKLDKLFTADFSDDPEEKLPENEPNGAGTGNEEYRDIRKGENATGGSFEGSEGDARLQRKADTVKAKVEDALDVYRTYQENIRTAGQLQQEIREGVYLGADIYSLFLKAVEAISLMTGDRSYREQIERSLLTVYGKGLKEPEPLALQLEAVQTRIEKLLDARKQEEEGRERVVLARAIDAHCREARRLQEIIKKSGEA